VEAFVKRNAIPWPCGYGVSRRGFAGFGVIQEADDPSGVGAIPTLFIVVDGVVHWNDNSSRYRHRTEGIEQLKREVEKALAGIP
jgi:hypothetical protein